MSLTFGNLEQNILLVFVIIGTFIVMSFAHTTWWTDWKCLAVILYVDVHECYVLLQQQFSTSSSQSQKWSDFISLEPDFSETSRGDDGISWQQPIANARSVYFTALRVGLLPSNRSLFQRVKCEHTPSSPRYCIYWASRVIGRISDHFVAHSPWMQGSNCNSLLQDSPSIYCLVHVVCKWVPRLERYQGV